MWDVKSAIISDLLTRCGFYLNYVGCKVSSLKLVLIQIHRFTLTMWDVKRVTMKLYDTAGNGFTLTMWDVKYG